MRLQSTIEQAEDRFKELAPQVPQHWETPSDDSTRVMMAVASAEAEFSTLKWVWKELTGQDWE